MSGFPAAIETNLTAAARAGLQLDADATAGTEGAYEQLVASTAAESEGGVFVARSVAASGVDTGVLIDLATGAAASESVIFPNMNMGEAESATVSMGKTYRFPQRIAASTRIACRMEAAVNSETAIVAVWLFQDVHHMENVGTAVTYGADEGAGAACGTSVTAASGDYGTWTEIATTSQDHNLFMVGLDTLGNTTQGSNDYLVQIGHGPDVDNVTVIGGPIRFKSSSSEAVCGPIPDTPIYASVSSGTKVWARVAAGDTNAVGITIHGMSGTEVSAGSGGAGPLIGGRLVR